MSPHGGLDETQVKVQTCLLTVHGVKMDAYLTIPNSNAVPEIQKLWVGRNIWEGKLNG